MSRFVILLAIWALSGAERLSFAATSRETALRPWNEYRVIMWVGDSAYRQPAKVPLFFQRLREMGVNSAMVYGGGGDPQPLLQNQFPYYVENIVNRGLCLKWNAQVRDWDAFVTSWAARRDEASLVREYGLEDPQWREWARQEMRMAASKHGPHQPLAYDIRDELSVTISANPFDYDFSPTTLRGFRERLRDQYGNLETLNRQWETRFESWAEVKPFTTDQIKQRMASGEALSTGRPDWPALQQLKFVPAAARQAPTRWNFSPWADFRSYMDLSLAGALADLRQAAHEADPRTPVGIEGTQMPHAFGGYDLWRLAQAVDWIEPYDIGNARAILGSFMPGKPILTTVFETDTNAARRRLWHLLLEGDRGCIIWWSEDCIDWQSADYSLTAKARALTPVLRELTSPLARLFLLAERQYDPILIHYSQASIQVDWLLESCADGSTWLRRFSSFEAEHNRMARVRASWLKAFEDLGYSPRFIASEQLEAGGWRDRASVLVLPTSRALSDKEGQAIHTFLSSPPSDSGGAREPAAGAPKEPAAGANGATRVVFADGTPGLFDAHGRLRPKSPLEGLFPLADSEVGCWAAHRTRPTTPGSALGDIAAYVRRRVAEQPDLAWAQWIKDNLAGVAPEIQVPLAARTRVHRYRIGEATLLAFERNVSYQMSEDLKQAGGNEPLERPVSVTAKLGRPAHVHSLHPAAYLGEVQEITFTLDPWQPALFALLPRRIPPETLVTNLLGRATP